MAEETKQQDSTEEVTPRFRFRRTPDYMAYYASNIRVGVTFFDFRFICGEVIGDDEGLIFNDKLGVVLSPQHAKVFLKVLKDHIEKYEEEFGPIPERPDSEITVDTDA